MKKVFFSLVVVTAMTLAAAAGPKLSSASSAPSPSAANLQADLPDGIGVASVDMTQLTGSPLWAALTTSDKPVRALQSLQNRLSDIGLKITDLTQVSVCVSAPGGNGLVAAVSGSIDESNLLSKLRANPQVKLTSEAYKNLPIYTAVITGKTVAHTQSVSFAFVGVGTLVLGTGKGTHAAVDAIKGDKPSMAQDSKLQAGLGETSAGAIRFAIALTPALTSQLESSSIPLPDFSTVSLAIGTIGVSSGIDLNVILRNDTAANATAMAAQLNSLLSMAKGILGSSTKPKNQVILDAVKTVAINAAGTDVKITGNLTADLISKVFH
jgi:hypothetical protein